MCLQVLRGFHGAALAHVDSGIKLYSQFKSAISNTGCISHYASLATFTELLARLDQQASSITTDRPRNLLSTPISICEQMVPEPKVLCFMVKPFQSMEEARSGLHKIQNAALRATSSLIDPTIVVDYSRFESEQKARVSRRGYSILRMHQWRARFEEYLFTHKATEDLPRRKATESLMIQWIVMCINFRVDFVAVTENEMLWDEFLPEFTELVTHVKRFTELETREDPKTPIFTLEIDIIVPLYFVAAKCRDGKLRREAIDLLNARERQEGIWNAALTSRLCSRLVRMEEAGLEGLNGNVRMEDVVCEKRIQGLEVKWDIERRRVNLLYKGVHCAAKIVRDGHAVEIEL